MGYHKELQNLPVVKHAVPVLNTAQDGDAESDQSAFALFPVHRARMNNRGQVVSS